MAKKVAKIQPVPIERQVAQLFDEGDIEAIARLLKAVDKILDVSPVETPSQCDIEADQADWETCHYCGAGGFGFWEHDETCEHENLRKARELVSVTRGAQ